MCYKVSAVVTNKCAYSKWLTLLIIDQHIAIQNSCLGLLVIKGAESNTCYTESSGETIVKELQVKQALKKTRRAATKVLPYFKCET
jgi:exosome complex RNA-binding protein Rrp42 (RNase PH superfamily)